MRRTRLMGLAGAGAVAGALSRSPMADAMASTFTAGPDLNAALEKALPFVEQGLWVSLGHFDPEGLDGEQVQSNAARAVAAIAGVAARGMADRADVAISVAGLGLRLPEDGFSTAEAYLRDIVVAAADAGVGLILNDEGHAVAGDAARLVNRLRPLNRGLALTLASQLHRSESDCLDVARLDARIRLVKGAKPDEVGVGFLTQGDIDRAYVRCLRILLSGRAHPIIATDDERVIDIARALAIRNGRERGDYEFALPLGVQAPLAAHLLADGEKVRVEIPYGTGWQDYVAHRVVENPLSLRRALPFLG